MWLAADDPARERRLVGGLRDRGIAVTARDSIRDRETALSHEGPTLALRLALLAGLVSLVLAALVLVVGAATSSESRARDLAGLRVVGVPARAIRPRRGPRARHGRRTSARSPGSSLGLVAAQAALPRLPLFARGRPPAAARARPRVVGRSPLAGATCLVLLVLVSVLRRPLAGRVGHPRPAEAGPMKRSARPAAA